MSAEARKAEMESVDPLSQAMAIIDRINSLDLKINRLHQKIERLSGAKKAATPERRKQMEYLGHELRFQKDALDEKRSLAILQVLNIRNIPSLSIPVTIKKGRHERQTWRSQNQILIRVGKENQDPLATIKASFSSLVVAAQMQDHIEDFSTWLNAHGIRENSTERVLRMHQELSDMGYEINPLLAMEDDGPATMEFHELKISMAKSFLAEAAGWSALAEKVSATKEIGPKKTNVGIHFHGDWGDARKSLVAWDPEFDQLVDIALGGYTDTIIKPLKQGHPTPDSLRTVDYVFSDRQ